MSDFSTANALIVSGVDGCKGPPDSAGCEQSGKNNAGNVVDLYEVSNLVISLPAFIERGGTGPGPIGCLKTRVETASLIFRAMPPEELF
jgi:hypothetical protein